MPNDHFEGREGKGDIEDIEEGEELGDTDEGTMSTDTDVLVKMKGTHNSVG